MTVNQIPQIKRHWPRNNETTCCQFFRSLTKPTTMDLTEIRPKTPYKQTWLRALQIGARPHWTVWEKNANFFVFLETKHKKFKTYFIHGFAAAKKLFSNNACLVAHNYIPSHTNSMATNQPLRPPMGDNKTNEPTPPSTWCTSIGTMSGEPK